MIVYSITSYTLMCIKITWDLDKIQILIQWGLGQGPGTAFLTSSQKDADTANPQAE